MFGHSPNLPVDAMMGTMSNNDGEEVSMPQDASLLKGDVLYSARKTECITPNPKNI